MTLTPRQRLDALFDTFVPDIRSAFYAAMQDVADNAVISDMTLAIEAGDVAGAFRALGFSPAAMRPLIAAIERSYETGGEATAATFPKFLGQSAPARVTYNLPPSIPPGEPHVPPLAPAPPPSEPITRAVFRFDVRNVSAENYLRDHSAQLVQRLTEEAETNVRNVMAEGLAAGNNPRTTALDIVGRIDQATGNRTGGVIGLTNQQEGWIRNVRSDLNGLDDNYFTRKLRDKRFDSIVRKAIDAKTPLPSDTVDKLVSRYKDNALKYRGETIARTEAMQALNKSEYEATLQAVAVGNVSASAVTREWDSAGDDRVRPSHAEMDGQRVGLHEAFVTPSGEKLMHPGDTSLGADASEIIDCRCRARTIIDWFAGVV